MHFTEQWCQQMSDSDSGINSLSGFDYLAVEKKDLRYRNSRSWGRNMSKAEHKQENKEEFQK